MAGEAAKMIDPEAFSRLPPEAKEYLKKRVKEAVEYIRGRIERGEEISDYQEGFLEAVGHFFPEPLKDAVTILVDCPHCGVSRCVAVSGDRDSILECEACEEKYRIRKERIGEQRHDG